MRVYSPPRSLSRSLLPRRFTFPPSIDCPAALKISRELSNLRGRRQIIFDFKALGYVCPFSLVFLATILEDTVSRLGEQGHVVIGHEKKSYLSHMGFFRAFGVPHGNAPGEAKGSSRYLP